MVLNMKRVILIIIIIMIFITGIFILIYSFKDSDLNPTYSVKNTPPQNSNQNSEPPLNPEYHTQTSSNVTNPNQNSELSLNPGYYIQT